MATPKNKRGFRVITVKEKVFNWCFQGVIDVRPEGKKNNRLIIDFGYYDPFDYLGTNEEMPPSFEPKIATPKFVSQSIEKAIELGWDIELKTGLINLKYRDKRYKLLK